MNKQIKELIIGCGHAKNIKRVISTTDSVRNYQNPTTLDIDPDCSPDVLWNLEELPLPFEDNTFDEIHAYEILEHTGQQGDYKFFFAQFSDFWRILKPNGVICATVPNWDNMWAWGDPSHKRIINKGTLIFLSQKQYVKQIGVTAMSDYRYMYKADFEMSFFEKAELGSTFVLKAISV